ncbi:hypothetical protein ZHAS_00012515 [Anopheles sinensis]|uniref:Uncharacterized protein n=1 Tax=Anopheles sinensis TaxID=74873 RepID=A0A084W336_ANOSI|nr:hypothetical protein ZHAS_00012515 [Anopheles sinensis]
MRKRCAAAFALANVSGKLPHTSIGRICDTAVQFAKRSDLKHLSVLEAPAIADRQSLGTNPNLCESANHLQSAPRRNFLSTLHTPFFSASRGEFEFSSQRPLPKKTDERRRAVCEDSSPRHVTRTNT